MERNFPELKTYGPEQTQLLGQYLGKLAQGGDIFLLSGELGTGKTCLTQGIARGLEIKENILSPSFVIIREHSGRLPLYHIDFYRLDDIGAIINLGLEEYLHGDGVCVIEWGERGISAMPQDNLLITLSYVTGSEQERIFHLLPKGQRYEQLVTEIEKNLRQGESWK